jgi:hypothetical protein
MTESHKFDSFGADIENILKSFGVSKEIISIAKTDPNLYNRQLDFIMDKVTETTYLEVLGQSVWFCSECRCHNLHKYRSCKNCKKMIMDPPRQ